MSPNHTRERALKATSLILTLYIAFVFIQSLFFKFSDSPETQYIFGTLDAWAASLGLAGLFAPSGPFSQYVVGSAELLASRCCCSAGCWAGRCCRPAARCCRWA